MRPDTSLTIFSTLTTQCMVLDLSLIINSILHRTDTHLHVLSLVLDLSIQNKEIYVRRVDLHTDTHL
jgi:hypothetical protein